ncbi:MAG: SGNH/GDSL hydrolase family protein [Clostridia bacterium]|nr:SGNH/GDSL hydrolase family protein [Clostridia bacterium]
MLKGKKLSILGDSLSTYKGVSNDYNANETTYINSYHYKEPFPLEGTYWMRLINAFSFELCVNNSWSGGNLSGKDDLTSGVNRAHQLSNNNGDVPEFIILFMGLNDLGRNVPVKIFERDYKATLSIIKEKYPGVTVCCVNLPDRDIYLRDRVAIFNEAIDSAVKDAGEEFFIADLYRSRLNNDFYYMNTMDGLHLDEDGMRIIGEIIEQAIREKFNV